MSHIWSVGMTLRDAEKNIIEQALKFYGYNKTMTASSLGISIRGLDHKMENLGVVNLKKVSLNERKDIGPFNNQQSDSGEDRASDK